MRANHMEINIQTCIIVHVYVCSWRIVVMMLDVWICIGKSLCSGMYKKKGLEEGGGASFVSSVSASEGIQCSSSRGGLESPRIQGGTQTCHCVLFSLLPGTLVRSLCSGSGTVSWVLD